MSVSNNEMARRTFLGIGTLLGRGRYRMGLAQSLIVAGASPAGSEAADQYGGYRVKIGKGTGFFRTEKVGNRWLLATPEGNAFWLLLVYNVAISEHVDERRGTYRERVIRKYGDAGPTWGPQQIRRLRSWGFNGTGEYSIKWVLPWTTYDVYGSSWDRGSRAPWPNPEAMPAVPIINASHYSLRNAGGRAPGPVKEIIKATGPRFTGWRGSFPDVFDRNFGIWLAGELRNYGPTPWAIGIAVDDTDYLTGFGPGPDFDTGRTHPHLGLVALITPPTQAENKSLGVKYSDTQVYTKLAIRDFLKRRYGTVAALNSSWGAGYTSWDSDGGWPEGKGLLDESGKGAWIGGDSAGLAGATPGVRADLDEFLYTLAKHYFATVKSLVRERLPNMLYLGPTSIGGWGAPARRQILKAAGEHVDVLRTTWQGQQDRLDFIATHAGDVPLSIWFGAVANPDSALYRYRFPWFSTQAERGQYYADTVSKLLNARVSGSGTHPFIGLQWWEFHDNFGEKANWGLVTLSDNAYDGKEAVMAPGRDPWGFRTGGEERDYGDLLSHVRRANVGVAATLQSELTRRPGAKG